MPFLAFLPFLTAFQPPLLLLVYSLSYLTPPRGPPIAPYIIQAISILGNKDR